MWAASVLGGVVMFIGIAWKVLAAFSNTNLLASRANDQTVLPTIPKAMQASSAPPAVKQAPTLTSGVEAWYRYRDELLAKGATSEEIEAMANKSWKYLLLEATTNEG